MSQARGSIKDHLHINNHQQQNQRKRPGHTRSASWQQNHIYSSYCNQQHHHLHHHQHQHQQQQVPLTRATTSTQSKANSKEPRDHKDHDHNHDDGFVDGEDRPQNDELKQAIKHLVANISKSFIVEWYTLISPTNHDFVVSCESLIENALNKLAVLSARKLDKYKIGQLVTSLLHDHILNDKVTEKIQSIENQIDEHEYDICQNSVVRLFGLLCTDDLRRVIFTTLPSASPPSSQQTTLSPTSSSSTNSTSSYYQQHKHHHYSHHQQQYYYSSSTGTASSARTNAAKNQYRESDQNCSYNQNETKTTSALYTLVIAMLTKAVFMQIVDSISEPNWLYAVIIWLCKKEERDEAKRKAFAQNEELNNRNKLNEETSSNSKNSNNNTTIDSSSSRRSISKTFGRNIFDENNKSIIKNDAINPIAPPIIQITNTRGYRSVDLEEGIDIASGNINFENPVCDSLKRPLDNIEIYDTEEVKTSGSCYVLYCIRYDGLCHRNPSASGFNFIPENQELLIIDKRATALTHRRLMSNEPCSSNTISNHSNLSASDYNNRKSFRRRMTIKRRFREFVILQLRLEENPKIRPYMKNIPKPTKLKAATQNIFSLPGITNIKLDQSTIRLRQRFLERFLTALNSSPFIANSYEFKEFFSYNVNAVNMTKSKSLILQVNLNKVFVDSVRSAFSIIRASLPGDDGVNLNTNSNSDPDAWLTELQQSTMKLHVQTRTSHTKMDLERFLDSRLCSFNEPNSMRTEKQIYLSSQYERSAFSRGLISREGSLKTRMIKSNSVSSNSSMSQLFLSRSSSSNSRTLDRTSSKSDSSESLYHNASSELPEQPQTKPKSIEQVECKAIQICDSVPIATKFIDIVHYSISRDSTCSNSTINFIARLLLGRIIERHAIKILDAIFTKKVVTFCINGITSSIWDESDDPPLDLENASLDEAVLHLTKLLEQNYTNYSFIPKNFLNSLISKQLRFYLSQLASQKRNKFAIYSFFVHLLDELESV